MKRSTTWVLNKKTGKFEPKPDGYKPPTSKIVKSKKPFRKKVKKPDKKSATAYYGSKQLDLQILKKVRHAN